MHRANRRDGVALIVSLALCWLPSAARAASYAELLARAEKAREHAAESGRTLVSPEQPAEPYSPTAADSKRGLVVYVPPIAEPFADRRPAAGEVRGAADVTAAPGEIESFLLAVHALKEQKALAWLVDGPTPEGVRLELLPVVMAPMAERRSRKYRVVGMWLAGGGAVNVEAAHSRAWLARVHVAENVRPGTYRITISATPKGRPGR